MKEKIGIADVIWLSLSSLLTAMGVLLFYSEYQLTPGGITGLSIAVSALSGVSVDVMSLSISIPLLIVSSVFLGSTFGLKTLFVTLMTPLWLRLIPMTHVTNSVLIAAIGGGLLIGISIGIAIRRTCATGGTDVIAMMLHRFTNWNVSVILFVCDGLIVLMSWWISQDVWNALYSGLSLLVIMAVIQIVTRNQTR